MTTPTDRLTPLRMAQNAARWVLEMADRQEADPTWAYIEGAGKVGADSAMVAGNMALVSIAESLDRIAALLGGGPGPVQQNHVDNAGHVLDDAGEVLDGGAGR